jgi:hypothetical protein
MGKGRKSEYIKFKYDKSKHCQCGTGKKGPEITEMSLLAGNLKTREY